MIVLAMDPCEARGGVVVRVEGKVAGRRMHEGREDYSGWLRPATQGALNEAGIRKEAVDILAAATGPGSFTGLRVGLTTVKAWAEVYGKPVVGVSRLEAMARERKAEGGFVAACFDAQRGEVFGAVYRSAFGRLAQIGDERVISPEGFVQSVDQEAGSAVVRWVSLDPEMITSLERWKGRTERGDVMSACHVAPVVTIAAIAEERAERGEFTDALALDANYVRRSDAEIFWKGTPGGR